MSALSIDDFLDAFSAKLVSCGESRIRLNEPEVRDGLFGMYNFFNERLSEADAKKDKELRYFLIDLRNAFKPSSIGSFDKLEALLGAKQGYLNSRPNPYYSEVLFPLSASSAQVIFDHAEPVISGLVENAVNRFMSAAQSHANR